MMRTSVSHAARLCLLLLLSATACNLPLARATPIPMNTPASPTPTAIPLDLQHQPLYWFAPLPALTLPGETDGSADFMDLFAPSAPWSQAASDIQVFKLYGGWAVRDSTIPQLTQAVQSIRQHGLALAVETGPLTPTSSCGDSVEGFAGGEVIQTLERIKSVGGDLNFIAFDEPYFYGHFYDGPNACHWSADKIATEVEAMIQRAHAVFPNVIIGDIEPVTGLADDQAYKQWLDTFRRVNGHDLAFLHLDMDWADTKWPQKAKSIEDYGAQRNVPVGIIYTGNFQDDSDTAWLAIAGERVKRYELESGGRPAHVIFQSWNDKPDKVLPESDPFTFTGFIKAYFENKAGLGFPPGFAGNLALKKTVQVSRAMPGFDGSLAVDGDAGTLWNSGDGPPEWIQIDLGQPYTISAIRLVISQYPAGATVHQVWGGADAGSLSLLHEFSGPTGEPGALEFKPSPVWTKVRYIKILTTQSPSWVAWREIEVTGQ